jgi:hypothetical protein
MSIDIERQVQLGWDDLKVPALTTKLFGVSDPDFVVYKTDGAGSRGVFLYWFDKLLEEEVFFIVQLPHSYKQGSDIRPHVHWLPKTTGGAGLFVKWGLEYTWANINGVYAANTTIITTDASSSSTATTSGDNIMTIDKHYVSSFPSITGTGKTISSMLICRVFRDATDATDDYDDDAGLLEFDIHFEKDTVGSRLEMTK